MPKTRFLPPALLVAVWCALVHLPVLGQASAAAPAGPRAAPAKPAADASGPSWASLSSVQRNVLAPLAKDWTSLDTAQKSKWLEVASKFPKMRPEDQVRVQERMAEWARMTPVERGQARLTFQESKQLSPEEKQQRWDAYNALPEAERRALAERSRRQAERTKPGAAPAVPLNESIPKQNLVATTTPASAPRGKPVAPTVVQAKPGATTTLMNKAPAPPSHQQPGQPKIAAKPGDVDPATLLPKSGPQAAASAPQQP